MAVRRISKGRSRQKQVAEPSEAPTEVVSNGLAENSRILKNGESPSFEQIQRRAYELFVARGASDGGDLADWLTAEQELTATLTAGH